MNRMFFVFLMLVGFQSSAQEVRENYIGVRSLGMGGVSIAVVNDETALLLNPAALGRLRDSYGTIFDPEFETSYTAKKMYDVKAFTNPLDLNQVAESAGYSPGSYYHAKGQFFPSYVAKNFGIGIHGLRTINARMTAAGTSLETYYRDDLGLYMGFNLRLFDGRIKIGAVGKAIARIEINEDLPMPGTIDLSQVASEGVGFGVDAGILMTAPVAWLPTLAGVVRDAGSTPFTGGSGVRMRTTDRPQTVEQDIDVGLSVFPIHGNQSRSSFALEYRKIKEAAEAEDKSRYYHVGYEYNYADILFLRMGMNQRYWTAGFELASEHTQFQLATYGEEIGTATEYLEDRRYVMKFSFRF